MGRRAERTFQRVVHPTRRLFRAAYIFPFITIHGVTMDEEVDLAKLLEESEELGQKIAWAKIFLDDVAGDNDRSAAITLATLIDDSLGATIQARLVPLSTVLLDRLYSDAGPLGSLNAKIDMGFALGLYDKQTRSDLHLVRRIRNKFAHTFATSSFEDEEIKPLCRELKTPNLLARDIKSLVPRFPEEKTRYFLTTIIIFSRLDQIRESIEPMSPIENTPS